MATKVLLVEDEKLLRESYQIILEAEGCQVDTAVNGLEALKLCAVNRYDLILLDIMMPELDGVGFMKKFAVNHKDKLPPIVILSNLSQGDEINQALQLGAKKYIQKSQLDPAGLIAILREAAATT